MLKKGWLLVLLICGMRQAMLAQSTVDFIRFDSVTSYKVVHGPKKTLLEFGRFMKNHIQQWFPNVGDSCVYDTDDFGNSVQYLDTALFPPFYNFILKQSYVGDSIIIRFLASNEFNPFPELVLNGEYLYTTVKIEAFYNDEASATKAATEVAKKYALRKLSINKEILIKENKVLDEYLKKNKLAPQYTTTAGVRVRITKPGIGAALTNRDTIKLFYKGRKLNGDVFDTNMNGDFGHPELMELDLGKKGAVIVGWEEGLMLFKKGAKGEMYIPSPAAYGRGGNGAIGPNEILIFDIEIVDVKYGAKPAPKKKTSVKLKR